MDIRTAEEMEKRLAQRAKERGTAAAPNVSAKPLYVQDLEERAKELGTTVAQVFQGDQQLLSQAYPTPDCLKPDQVMQCARDEKLLSVGAWEHYQACTYCQGVVAMARPDVARYRALLTRLAAPEPGPTPVHNAPAPIIRRTQNFFAALDRLVVKTARGGALAAACVLLVVFFGPDSFQAAVMGPIKAVVFAPDIKKRNEELAIATEKVESANKQVESANKQVESANKQVESANKQVESANKQVESADKKVESAMQDMKKFTAALAIQAVGTEKLKFHWEQSEVVGKPPASSPDKDSELKKSLKIMESDVKTWVPIIVTKGSEDKSGEDALLLLKRLGQNLSDPDDKLAVVKGMTDLMKQDSNLYKAGRDWLGQLPVSPELMKGENP